MIDVYLVISLSFYFFAVEVCHLVRVLEESTSPPTQVGQAPLYCLVAGFFSFLVYVCFMCTQILTLGIVAQEQCLPRCFLR